MSCTYRLRRRLDALYSAFACQDAGYGARAATTYGMLFLGAPQGVVVVVQPASEPTRCPLSNHIAGGRMVATAQCGVVSLRRSMARQRAVQRRATSAARVRWPRALLAPLSMAHECPAACTTTEDSNILRGSPWALASYGALTRSLVLQPHFTGGWGQQSVQGAPLVPQAGNQFWKPHQVGAGRPRSAICGCSTRGKAEKHPLSDASLHGCRVKY